MEYLKETFRVDQGVVHLVVEQMQAADGRGDIVEEQQMKHDRAHAHASGQHEIGGEQDDGHRADLFHEAFHSVKEEACLADAHLGVCQGVLEAELLAFLNIFTQKGLDDGHGFQNAENSLTLVFPQTLDHAA